MTMISFFNVCVCVCVCCVYVRVCVCVCVCLFVCAVVCINNNIKIMDNYLQWNMTYIQWEMKSIYQISTQMKKIKEIHRYMYIQCII